MMNYGYFGNTFFSFFKTLFTTLLLFMQGKVSLQTLASDEIQILVLSCIGVSSALVGSFLILRKMTMVANAISHTALIGIVMAIVFFRMVSSGSPLEVFHIDLKVLLLASVFSSLLTMFLTNFFNEYLRLQKDASIGLVFSFLFALGIILVTIFTRNSHVGIELIMGNVDMVHKDDVVLSFFLMIFNIALIVLFYKEYVITAFDSEQSVLLQMGQRLFTTLLILQTSATVIGAFRVVGVVLVLALLIIPPMTARLYTVHLRKQLVLASLMSIVISIFSVALSRHILTVHGISLSTGGIVVTMQITFWLLSLMISPLRGILPNLYYQRRLRLLTKSPQK